MQHQQVSKSQPSPNVLIQSAPLHHQSAYSALPSPIVGAPPSMPGMSGPPSHPSAMIPPSPQSGLGSVGPSSVQSPSTPSPFLSPSRQGPPQQQVNVPSFNSPYSNQQYSQQVPVVGSQQSFGSQDDGEHQSMASVRAIAASSQPLAAKAYHPPENLEDMSTLALIHAGKERTQEVVTRIGELFMSFKQHNPRQNVLTSLPERLEAIRTHLHRIQEIWKIVDKRQKTMLPTEAQNCRSEEQLLGLLLDDVSVTRSPEQAAEFARLMQERDQLRTKLHQLSSDLLSIASRMRLKQWEIGANYK